MSNSNSNKFDRFDFEQQILGCWNIITDLKDLSEGVLESDMSKDEITNVLMGLEQLYELRFNKLFRQFEKLVGEHHKSLDGEVGSRLRDLAESREMDNNLRGFFGGGVSVEPKPNPDLNEMWTELEKYQPYADRRGFGEAWKRMTTERTVPTEWGAAVEAAAQVSEREALDPADVAAWAAWWAAYSAYSAPREEDVSKWSQIAIENIRKAIELEKSIEK